MVGIGRPKVQATVQAHRTETTIQPDGSLLLNDLPFAAGEPVEVIILPRSGVAERANPYLLRGTPIRFNSPFEPVAPEDWDAAR